MQLHPRVLVPLVGFFAFASAAAQDRPPQHLLRLSFEVGRSQFYRDTVETTTKGKGPAAAHTDMTMNMETIREERVIRVEVGKAQIEQIIHRMIVRITGPFQVEYDSDDPDSDPGLLQPAVEMVGKVSRWNIDDRGRISNLEMPEGAEAAIPFAADMRGWMSGAELPETPVAIGATWVMATTAPVGGFGEFNNKIVNKLVKVDKGKATLEQDMQMDTEDLTLPGGMTMECDARGGVTVIDLATGRTLESTTTMVTRMTGGPGGMEMTTTTSMRCQAIDPPEKKREARPDADKE